MSWFRRRPISVRITIAFLVAMAVLLLGSAAFIYERMQFALDRSIHDVPASNPREIAARRAHRNEALDELLAQLAVAYGATLAIAGFVGYRMTRAALDPVEQMQSQASAPGVPSGSLVQLPVAGADDELSRLARTLNALLADTHHAAERQRQFVADASHELRTPLSRLQLQVDLALSRERSADELRQALGRIRSETTRLVRLANDLLLLAQADEGRLGIAREPTDLDDALRRAAAPYTNPETAAATVAVAASAAEAPRIAADPDRLHQALTNLIDNALRHGGSHVELSWRLSDTGEAEIRVRDDGPGFPAHYREAAFDRFSVGSGGRSAGGAGLGLSIVKAIADAHGGSVSLRNVAPTGADVAITIPLAQPNSNGAASGGLAPAETQA